MKGSLFNEGVLEGLKIARVFVTKELLISPDSKKLKRIFVELEKCIQQERMCIGLQTLGQKDKVTEENT